MTTKRTAQEAKQGTGGQRVLIILIVGMALAALGAGFMDIIEDDSATTNIGAPGVEPVPGSNPEPVTD